MPPSSSPAKSVPGDTVTLGGKFVPSVAFRCGHDNEGVFVGAAGLLGLGGGVLSFPNQFTSSSFSYCIVDRDSTSSSTLEFDAPSAASAVTALLLRNGKQSTFYYVGLAGISVGGRMLSIPPTAFAMDESGQGGVTVDCGPAVARLNSDVYALLRDAFRRGTGTLPSAMGVARGPCRNTVTILVSLLIQLSSLSLSL